MVNYSQSTVLSRGGFAPNIQYNTSVRMPTQPMPDLKQPDSRFNIDLTGLGRGLAQAAYQERLAQKEATIQAEKERIAALKTGLGQELNQIQMGVDQNAFSAEAGQRKSREVLDKYIGIGLDPDEVFPIYENAVSLDVRDIYSNRRKNIETAKNEVESAIVKDVWSKVPETTNWSYEETLNYGRYNQMVADEVELSTMYGVGVEEAANKFIDVQAGSTILNMQQDLIGGTLAGPEAKLQLYRSASMALAKKNPNMSAAMIKDLTTRRLAGVNSYIDMITTAKEADRKLITDRFDAYVKENKLQALQYLDPEDRSKVLFGLLDPMNMEDARVFGPKATQIGTQEVTSADGRTTTSQPTYLVQDISGNNMVVTAASSEEAIEILSNASKRVYSEGSDAILYIKQALPQAYNNSNISVKDFQTMSPEDATTLAENRKAVDAVAGSVNNRNTLKNDTASQNYIDNQFNITAGIEVYNKVPGVKEVVKAIDADVRSLTGNEVMLANTRINKEGYLVAATDVQGGLGTLQQYLTGAKYRDNLDKVNRGLSGISVMYRPNVARLMLASYGKNIKNYDPNVDGEMTSIATPGERAAQDTFEIVGEGWRWVDKEARDVWNKYVDPYYQEFKRNLPAVIEDIKGGEGTYSEYIKDNIKEATTYLQEYVIKSIANYKALQAGKDAPDLAGIVNSVENREAIVNKPEESVESDDILNDFLQTIKYYADPSHYEIPEIRLDRVIPREPIVNKPEELKEEKKFMNYLKEEVNTLVDNVVDELSSIAEPAIEQINALKTGFKIGERHASIPSWMDDKSWEMFATTMNDLADKPLGYVRQILASIPFAIGWGSGVTWEMFRDSYMGGLHLDPGVEEKLLKKAYNKYGEIYRKNTKLLDRINTKGYLRVLAHFDKQKQNVKEYDYNETSAKFEPYLYE